VPTENKYFDDAFSELVVVDDGIPVRYCSLARRTEADEPQLAERIRALTGHAVRFGKWDQREPIGRDFESASEVDLFVIAEPGA